MVEISDIQDQESLQAWLEDKPRELSVWIAARAATRVLPVWWGAVLTERWAHEGDVTALPVLRSVLISSAAAFRPTDYLGNAASASGYGSVAYAEMVQAPDHAARAFAAAAYSVSATAHAVENAAESDASAAAFAAFTAASAPFWQAIRTDAEQAADGTLPEDLPLWPEGKRFFGKAWSDIKAQVADSPDAADWQFWLEWYEAQISGRTMLPDPSRTWDMLEQIALIKPETWDAGPDTVNPLIREIWKLHRLRSEVATLQAEKDAFLATRASEVQRSHNQPPDGLVDDQPELARQITIVGNSLDEARDALEQDAPDKGWLRAIAEKLLSALTTVTKYCAKVADTAVISAAKVGGGAGGAAMVDYFANNGRLMQFAKDLLSYAAGV